MPSRRRLDLLPEEGPVTSVTNGVHVPTWIAPEMSDLYTRRMGEDWQIRLDDAAYWKKARRIPDGDLWEVKRSLKERWR